MVEDTIEAVSRAAGAKSRLLEGSLARYLVLAMLAGAYVGLGIVLIFAIGAPLAAAQSPFLKVVMGASFGVALTLVIFAGSELFTGNALVLAVGVLDGRSSWCLFAFIGAGFEHSVANMTLLALALFQQHGEAVS